MSSAVSDGVLPTFTPTASRASFLACAVPDEPDTIAPAWPIVLPSGTAQAKKEALEAVGVKVGKTPSETAELMREILKNL